LGENSRKEVLPLEFASVIIRLINNEGMKQKKQLTVQNRWMRMPSIIPVIATHAFEGKQKIFLSGSLNGRPPVLLGRRPLGDGISVPSSPSRHCALHTAQSSSSEVYARRNLQPTSRHGQTLVGVGNVRTFQAILIGLFGILPMLPGNIAVMRA
jgi:hypothetical protein